MQCGGDFGVDERGRDGAPGLVAQARHCLHVAIGGLASLREAPIEQRHVEVVTIFVYTVRLSLQYTVLYMYCSRKAYHLRWHARREREEERERERERERKREEGPLNILHKTLHTRR